MEMDKIRILIIYIILWIVTAIASFEGGIIYTWQKDIPKRLFKLEYNIQELTGEIQTHKAMLRGISQGRKLQVP